MKLAWRIAVVFFFGIAATSRAQSEEDAYSGLAHLVVSLNEPTEFLKWAKKTLQESLRGISVRPKAAPQSEILADGRVIIWGNLFKTGGCFALIELAPQGEASDFSGMAFAEWKEGNWELRGLWKIQTVWRPKGWKSSDQDDLDVEPASQPFELRDLSNDGVPEVVAAGEVHYFQENYLFRFSASTHTLRLVASAMAKPEISGKYVRLYSKSPRRAIYEEWQFLKWQGDRLVPVATWHDEVGYGNNDLTFSEGKQLDRSGKTEIVRVVYGKGTEYESDFYGLERDGKPFGRMRVRWKDEKNRISMHSDEIEKEWLFTKTTGMPRQLYPTRESQRNNPRLEDYATVTVEGNAAASKLFSTGKKWWK